MRTGMSRRGWSRALGVALAVGLPACGWQYAQEIEARDRALRTTPAVTSAPARPEVAESSAATGLDIGRERPGHSLQEQVIPSRDLPTLERNHSLSAQASTADDMARHAFSVTLVDTVNHARQLIHCSSGKVVRFDRTPSEAMDQALALQAGRPLGVWVLEVDPTGQRSDLPGNAEYRHISKFHRLEFIGRSRVTGTVLYRYLGVRDPSAGVP